MGSESLFLQSVQNEFDDYYLYQHSVHQPFYISICIYLNAAYLRGTLRLSMVTWVVKAFKIALAKLKCALVVVISKPEHDTYKNKSGAANIYLQYKKTQHAPTVLTSLTCSLVPNRVLCIGYYN